MSIVPITITSEVSGVSGRKVPKSAWDQAVASLAANPSILLHAWTGFSSVGGAAPIDRVVGNATLLNGGASIVADDVEFGHTSVDVETGAGASVQIQAGDTVLPSSYTMGCVFAPKDVTGIFLGLGTVPYGIRCDLTSTELRANSDLVSPTRATTSKSALNFEDPNVLIVSIDNVNYEVALYINSTTPIVASGGASNFPTLTNLNRINFGCGGATGADGSDAKFAGGFFAGEALYASAAGRSRAHRLIEAAAATYGIVLT
ncbi:MAG: hypothetical protein AAFY82_00085 [Pseudomonadota bacterium]